MAGAGRVAEKRERLFRALALVDARIKGAEDEADRARWDRWYDRLWKRLPLDGQRQAKRRGLPTSAEARHWAKPSRST